MAGSTSRSTFFCLHYMTLSVTFAFFVASIVLLFVNAKGFVLLQYFPKELFYVAIGFSGISFLLSALAIYSLNVKSRGLFILYFLFSILVVCIYTLITVFLFNTRISMGNLDRFIRFDPDTIAPTAIDTVFNNPESWTLTQNKLECCALNFETMYLEGADAFVTGDECVAVDFETGKVGRDQILVIQASFPTYSPAAQQAADDDSLLGKEGFFCDQNLVEAMEKLMLYFSCILAVFSAVELICFVCAVIILFCLPADRGGVTGDNNKANQRRRNPVGLTDKRRRDPAGQTGQLRRGPVGLRFEASGREGNWKEKLVPKQLLTVPTAIGSRIRASLRLTPRSTGSLTNSFHTVYSHDENDFMPPAVSASDYSPPPLELAEPQLSNNIRDPFRRRRSSLTLLRDAYRDMTEKFSNRLSDRGMFGESFSSDDEEQFDRLSF